MMKIFQKYLLPALEGAAAAAVGVSMASLTNDLLMIGEMRQFLHAAFYDLSFLTLVSALFGYGLMLVCERHYERRVLSDSRNKAGILTFRALFLAGIAVFGVPVFILMQTASFPTGLALLAVFLILAASWLAVLLYLLLTELAQWIAGKCLSRPVRLARRWLFLLSVPYFILVSILFSLLEL